MNSSDEGLGEVWRTIELDRDPSQWSAVRLPGSAAEKELLLATDPDNGRHLLIPAGSGLYPTDAQSPLSVDIGEQRFEFKDGSQIKGRFLDISCSNPPLFFQFDRVIESVLEAIHGSSDPARRAVSTVTAWRRLFSKLASATPLSLEQKFGAFAELSVMNYLIEFVQPFSTAWWTGPSNAPHDFELPSASLEVKAIGKASKVISIHGADQLQSQPGKPLFLVVVEVEEDTNGTTLGELLELITPQVSEPDGLRRKAASLGIFRTTEDRSRLKVKRLGIASVTAEFPRLISEEFPTQLQDALGVLQYELQLSEIAAAFNFIDPYDLKDWIESKD